MAGAAGMKGDILNWLKKSKHIWIIPVYTVLYMLSFMFVEQSEVETHLIHSLVDDKIPFCELGVGMTIFLIVSYVYPNGQNLRPELTGDSIFIQAVQFLYRIDTPTNIFPSMHVFNATAACVALFQNRRLRKHRMLSAATLALTVSIILSTMFLKQHSVADVMTALILNIICYQVFYRIIPANQEKIGRILTWKEIGTVPNLISAARLVLAVLFLGFFERYGLEDQKTALTVLLAAAAILPLVRFFLQSAKMKKAAASNPNYTATRQEYAFGEENFTLRICVRGKEEEYAIPYAQVLRAYEAKEYFYLYIGGGKVLILPKGAITEGSADGLAACLRAMGKRFREKRSCRRA